MTICVKCMMVCVESMWSCVDTKLNLIRSLFSEADAVILEFDLGYRDLVQTSPGAQPCTVQLMAFSDVES